MQHPRSVYWRRRGGRLLLDAESLVAASIYGRVSEAPPQVVEASGIGAVRCCVFRKRVGAMTD